MKAETKATIMATSSRWSQATQRVLVTRPLPVFWPALASMLRSALRASTNATIAKITGSTSHDKMAQTRATTAVPSVVAVAPTGAGVVAPQP